MKILDCQNMKCPQPVLETRKILLAEPGKTVRVLVADTVARDNVTRLAQKQGYKVSTEEIENGFALDLSSTAADVEKQPQQQRKAGSGKTVVYIGSDTMGTGNDELGQLLMRNFLFTITELEQAPDSILFVNTGVKLTTEGSEVLEALETLAGQGTDIASCGLCLDFFGLKDKLKAGRISNILETAEALSSAERIIRP